MITTLEMINWRAYTSRKIVFDSGITFLMGPNGAGKTSILEAIIYALTGEPTTVKEPSKFMRDPEQPALIRLSFTVSGKEFQIERTQLANKAGSARLIEIQSGHVLAATHALVTKHVEGLMGLSADFLQRIVYMSEGDVFRFMNQAPGRALSLQVRNVLGLTQLDQFVAAVTQAEKAVDNRIAPIQELIAIVDKPGNHGADFASRLEALDARRDQLLQQLADLRLIQQHAAREQEEQQHLQRMRSWLKSISQQAQQDSPSMDWFMELSLHQVYSFYGEMQANAERELEEHLPHIDWIRGAINAWNELKVGLAIDLGKEATVPCPVCAKPITMNERSQIDHNVDVEVERLRSQMEELEHQIKVIEQRVDETNEDFDEFSEIYDALVNGRIRSISPDATLEQLMPLFQEAKDAAESVVSVVDARLNAAQESLARLDNERAEYAETTGRLKALGLNTITEARRALVDLEMRSLTLRASKSASSKVQATLRDIDLQPIYAQVSKVWAAFSGKENWQVQLDEKGVPTLTSHEGRTFDLSQFSGGEKTALLLMLHTIIAQHFSKSDFLLVDEPLEHLDPINRRSLVRFLIDASKRGSFKQALVATFEESLLRKYMSEEGVHIIHV